MERKEGMVGKMVKMTRVTIVCLVMLAVTSAASAELSDVVEVYADSGLTVHQLGAPVYLPSTSDYKWWYGCTPTSAGMAMGYYDRNGYGADPLTNQYPNLVPGGLAETETHTGPPTGANALGNDAVASPGHLADFWVAYGNSGPDPLASGRTNPGDFDCLADFMGTSQAALGSSDGSTWIYNYNNGAKFYADDAEFHGVQDLSGMYGIYEYAQYSGYSNETGDDLKFFNQYIDAQGLTYGFTFAEYKAEIDAGRPVLVHVEGHTMCGIGYDTVGNIVELYDTWSAGPHTMIWGSSYSGLQHYGVTCFELSGGVPEPATMSLLACGALALIRRRRRSA